MAYCPREERTKLAARGRVATLGSNVGVLPGSAARRLSVEWDLYPLHDQARQICRLRVGGVSQKCPIRGILKMLRSGSRQILHG
jgi:hypothetical protein